MRLPRKIAGRRLPSLAVKLKPTSSVGLRDILSTFLVALQQSADAFPPLKSAVGGVLAVVDITQRAKHCKSDAQHIARRANEILDLIADAVPDGSAIPPPMELRIERFTTLLNETHATMKAVALTSRFSRFTHLNRNEAVLQGIKLQLDDAYRDFLAVSALRVETQQAEVIVQQAKIAVQQTQTHVLVEKNTASLAYDLSNILFYSRFATFFGQPLM